MAGGEVAIPRAPERSEEFVDEFGAEDADVVVPPLAAATTGDVAGGLAVSPHAVPVLLAGEAGKDLVEASLRRHSVPVHHEKSLWILCRETQILKGDVAPVERLVEEFIEELERPHEMDENLGAEAGVVGLELEGDQGLDHVEVSTRAHHFGKDAGEGKDGKGEEFRLREQSPETRSF